MKKLIVILLSAMFILAGCSNNEVTNEEISAPTVDVETISTEVTTLNGIVTGTEIEDTLVWYGIPYGESPVGDLRWAEPVPVEAWEETLDCTTVQDMALQVVNNEVTGTEDCLNLDIYSKEDANDLPVLVYIHGGNNQSGTSMELQGTDIVQNDDAVYVTINYRLGLLGFNDLPAITSSNETTGNFAMLDIALALDWINANIQEFGGNPDNITISGFSAGGRDVMAMLISPVFEDKFDKAIVFSGGMTLSEDELSIDKIGEALAPIVIADNKATDTEGAIEWITSDNEEVKEYLQGLDSNTLVTLMTNAGIRMSVFPHLYQDGISIDENGFETTSYNSVPVMMLSGTTEFSFFSLYDPYFSSDDLADLSEDEMNAAKLFVVKYGSEMYKIFNTTESAKTMINNYDEDIYLTWIDYANLDSEIASNLPMFGSFHGIFVPMLTSVNNYTAYFPEEFSKAGYQDMASIFNSYLENFLSTGNPNGEELTEWNPWTSDNQSVMVLDANNESATSIEQVVSLTYSDIIEEMENDTTVSDDVKLKLIQNIMNGRWFSAELDAYYENSNLWSVK